MPGRILVLEDDPDQNLLICDVLSADGHTCLSARSVDEAERLLAAQPPALAILDMNLPGRSGLEALATIRRTPDLAEIGDVSREVCGLDLLPGEILPAHDDIRLRRHRGRVGQGRGGVRQASRLLAGGRPPRGGQNNIDAERNQGNDAPAHTTIYPQFGATAN